MGLKTFHNIVLNDHYVFENYILGPSNQLAHAASMAICDSPGNIYNPFFIHSAVGMGKTHLLQAVCCRLIEKNPDINICFISCDEFSKRYLSAVQNASLDEFYSYFDNVDVFVVDDVHFLSNRETSQEQFFHIFNTLYNGKKQIIMSSDSSPDDIPELEERVISRFKWGLVVQIEVPTFETRLEIINRKVDSQNILVPSEIRELLAQKISTNIRELEGALMTIIGRSALLNIEIDEALVKDAIPDLFKDAPLVRITMDHIMRIVSKDYNVSISDLQSKERTKNVSFPRQIIMYLARILTNYSLEEIGGYLGGRDHTTVLHAFNKIQKMVDTKEDVKNTIDILTSTIKENTV